MSGISGIRQAPDGADSLSKRGSAECPYDLLLRVVGRPGTKLFAPLVVLEINAASAPASCVARATTVVSTVSRSSVELTTGPILLNGLSDSRLTDSWTVM
jgi:hypothetical protein